MNTPATSAKDAGDVLAGAHDTEDGGRKIRLAISNCAPMTAADDGGARRDAAAAAVLIPMKDIQRTQLTWLWPGRFPRKCVCILAGMPGKGKSTLTTQIAATVTTGGRWPDGSESLGSGEVIFITSEDDPASTTRPRIEEHGGDISRVFLLDMVLFGEKEELFTLNPSGLAALKGTLAERRDVRLLVIDPISSVLGGINSHRDADVRQVLRPLADLAREYDVTILLVAHLNKSQMGTAVERVGGSIGFVGLARVAHLVVEDANEPDLRWFLEIKNNVGRKTPGLAFKVVPSSSADDVGVIDWVERTNPPTADEALQALIKVPQAREATNPVDEASEWLEEYLARGPKPAKEVEAAAQRAGHAVKTLTRAKRKLQVESRKDGLGAWSWVLPGADHATAQVATFMENAPAALERSSTEGGHLQHLTNFGEARTQGPGWLSPPTDPASKAPASPDDAEASA